MRYKKTTIFFLLVPVIIVLLFLIFIHSKKEISESSKLIDESLQENYPIMFIVSPTQQENYVSIITMCLYNNGKYITGYYVTDTMETYKKEAEDTSAFIEMLKNGYEDNLNMDISHFLTTDIEPSEAKKYYSLQYDIKDFSLDSEIDMKENSTVQFSVYGVTYEKGVGTSHLYFATEGKETMQIKDKKGMKILTWIFSKESEVSSLFQKH